MSEILPQDVIEAIIETLESGQTTPQVEERMTNEERDEHLQELRSHEVLRAKNQRLQEENEQLRRTYRELDEMYDRSVVLGEKRLDQFGTENRRLYEELERAGMALGEAYQAVLVNEEKNVVLDSLLAAMRRIEERST